MAFEPEVDPATAGITFVDILFALAVGVLLDPIRAWAVSHTKNPLPGPEIANLGVGLTLILASFIGYHNSENRPRFKIRFVNVSFVKFILDIAMVIVYFVFAAYAAVTPSNAKVLSLLVVSTFVLYTLWDFAGWYEKTKPTYKAAWTKALQNPNRPDVVNEWSDLKRKRILPTLVGLVCSLGLWLYIVKTGSPPTPTTAYVVDALMIVTLFGYRVTKDNFVRS